jgi:hypothetical protein
MVTRLDRLARSTRDLLNTLAAITEKKAGFRSLGDAWADTTTAHGRLMLTVLGGLAEFERELIRTRTGEGRARAKADGKSLAASRNSPRTRKKRRFAGATRASQSARSRAPTMSARVRFRGSPPRFCVRATAAFPLCAAPRGPHEQSRVRITNEPTFWVASLLFF